MVGWGRIRRPEAGLPLEKNSSYRGWPNHGGYGFFRASPGGSSPGPAVTSWTLFNRGRSNPGLISSLEKITGDRTAGLEPS